MEDLLPSMPKGETVGNVVIDGKGDGKGGTPETATRQREQHRSREIAKEASRCREGRAAETGPFKEVAEADKKQRQQESEKGLQI